MPTFLAPVGHYSQRIVLLVSELIGAKVVFGAPDADLKDPVLTLETGEKLKTTPVILKYLCLEASSKNLYPEWNNSLASRIDQWMDGAREIEIWSRAWIEPSCQSPEYAGNVRGDFKRKILNFLDGLEVFLVDRTFLAGDGVTLCDLMMLGCLTPLFEGVIGMENRKRLGAVVRWYETCRNHPDVAEVLGDVKMCASPDGWQEPQVSNKKNKKKKQQDGANSNSNSTSQTEKQGNGEEDPEKKAKKERKAKEKEEKKKKALLKKQQAAQTNKAPGNSKRAEAKAEAERKRLLEKETEERIINAAKATPKGQKKDVKMEMCKGYCPPAVEAAWYDWWDNCGFFKPDNDRGKEPFVIVIPPPNVTGALHIGHALTNSIEDTIVRWRRMSGYNVLWVPGTDHAGIATQTVVEKKIQRERGLTRHDLGREKFLEEVWEWVSQYRGKIRDQLMRIGSSVDWERQRFTMDSTLSKAVLEAFVQLYDRGLIYRDNRLVNWCCKLRTALSDIEVDYKEIPGKTMISVPGFEGLVECGVLTSFAYPLEEGGEIVVATTRPETMLGDTAVAVHPNDPRYKHLHGKFAVHPVHGRKIPIITDAELVDMEFGTGAVKITPAHDPNDYLVGKRHNLEFINVLGDDGMINEAGSQFQGQHRFTARVTVVDFLKEKGLFKGTEDNAMSLPICSRSGDVIEPVLKPQWWVDCKEMGAAACNAVREGKLEIIPKDFEATWYRWLENIRDWCVSRQLWWGHRIPAYYIMLDGEQENGSGKPGFTSELSDRWVVGRSYEEAESRAKSKFPGKSFKMVQDEDVLDTWFSSGLFPFSVFSWPDATEDLAKYYPNALLETGHDILFFWVARMVMMGMSLTGEVPFKQVYLHSMVRDAHGRKMSKSLGNVIDPVHVIEGISLEGLHQTLQGGNLDAKEVEKATAGQKADFPEGIAECGTDALRFALLSYTSQGRDINLDIKRVVAYRHWCNKLWNAIKFAMINLPDDFIPSMDMDVGTFPTASKWILSRLGNSIKASVEKLEGYDFGGATQAIYAFWQDNLCDVFIEVMKPVMALDDSDASNKERKRQTQETLWLCLDNGLRLLHPFMPFVTEELWQRLPKRADQAQFESIMISPYPVQQPGWIDETLESDMQYINKVISRIRQMRADYGLTSKQKAEVYITCSDGELSKVLSDSSADIATLSYSVKIAVMDNGERPPQGCSVGILDALTSVHLLLKGILDPDKELVKLGKKLGDAEKQCKQLTEKMALPSYTEKTPENIKEEDKGKLSAKEAEIENIKASIKAMEELKLAK